MKLLLTGGDGQLGTEVQRRWPSSVELLAPSMDVFDLTQSHQVRAYIKAHSPSHILHAAAWTAVDAAEKEPEKAHAVNVEGTRAIAEAAAACDARMLYVSTDFVFGLGHDRPIAVDAQADPLSVYGRTKYEGECVVRDVLGERGTVVRTSWVYAAHGQNFVKTMLRLMQERRELSIVADQVGVPTWAGNLASFCLQMLREDRGGTWHFGDAGVASWYDFAHAIYKEGLRTGMLQHHVQLRPIRTEAYPTPAVRPRYSLLDRQAAWDVWSEQPFHWRDVLVDVMYGLRSTSA